MISSDPFSAIGMKTSGFTLATPVESSTITIARFSSDDPKSDVTKSLAAQDAYLLISPLRDLAQHDVWRDGTHEHRALFKAEEFTVVDLNSPVACRIRGPFDCLQVHIPRRALEDFYPEPGARVGTLQIGQEWNIADPVVVALKDCLARAISQPTGTVQLFIDHIVLALRAHIARAYGGATASRRLMRGGLASWQRRRAQELLASDLCKSLSLQQIARECELSVAHFSRSFKISTGATPHEWLQFRRIERAKELLAEGGAALCEIALRCGYSDQSHFTRMFARIVGITPGSWRRMHTN